MNWLKIIVTMFVLALTVPASAASGSTPTTTILQMSVMRNRASPGAPTLTFFKFNTVTSFGGCYLDSGKLYMGIAEANSDHNRQVLDVLKRAFELKRPVQIGWDDTKLAYFGICEIQFVTMF